MKKTYIQPDTITIPAETGTILAGTEKSTDGIIIDENGEEGEVEEQGAKKQTWGWDEP